MSSEIDAKIRRMMDNMPVSFKPEKAEGVNAVIQYNLAGDGGSNWFSTIGNGVCTVTEGEAEAPTLTINMGAQDYIDMMAGRLDAMQAFMTGKIKVEGDIMLASRMMSFFN